MIIKALLFAALSINVFGVCTSHLDCKYKHTYQNNFLTYYSSHKIEVENSKIERLVIVVHGALRNGHTYFDNTMKAALKFGVENKTLVVAPTFRKVTDDWESGELYWGRRWYTKWKYGYVSESSDKVSSFTVMDHFIQKVNDSKNFPNLKEVVVTGHSAGGQFSQRYAVGTRIRETIDAKITFVPSNPSSYMYLDPVRFDFVDGNYVERAVSTDCSGYNDYIYGPTNRAKYLEAMSVKELRENFKENNVVYLMSEEDKGTDSLDRTCEAMTQGKNRIDRAMNYWYYDKKFFGTHEFKSIPGVGHEHAEVYSSNEAKEVIFGITSPKSQHYLYRKVGKTQNVEVETSEIYLLLGGGKNEHKGFSYFLEHSNGGNVLVISAKPQLNHRYTHDLWRMAEQEQIKLNSVETISFLSRSAGSDSFVLNKIKNADAIFFTGGNQARYINRIKGTLAHKEILKKVNQGIAIGGTSAGLAIMGEYIFSAKGGGLSSRYVLRNPLSDDITIENDFFYSSVLSDLITDTHFMNRKREGRLLGFMHKSQREFLSDYIYGLGIDERSSVLLKKNKMLVYGDAYLYRNNSLLNQNQSNGLNYGPIEKIKLPSRKILPHFRDIDFSRGELIDVKDGIISKK